MSFSIIHNDFHMITTGSCVEANEIYFVFQPLFQLQLCDTLEQFNLKARQP